MKRSWFTRMLQSILVGGSLSIVFPALLHRLWWDRHPGSQDRFREQFLWYLLGAMILIFVGYLVAFYVREYWQVWFTDSQEEHHGIQR